MGWIYIKETNSYRWVEGRGFASVPNIQEKEKNIVERNISALGESRRQVKEQTQSRPERAKNEGNIVQRSLGKFYESRMAMRKGRFHLMKRQTEEFKAEKKLLKERKAVMGLRSEIEQMHSPKKEKRKAIDDMFGFG